MENKMFQNINEFEKEFIGEESSKENESKALNNEKHSYVAPICVHFVTNNLLIH
jgi:hypothetical protein